MHIKNQSGFSILEVLITAAVIGIITAVIVVRYSAFNNAILLKSQAYEIALDIREAQSFAVGGRGQGNEFRQDYGIYFDINTSDRYILFQDSDDIEVATRYDSVISVAYYDSGEEIAAPYLIDSRFELLRICINNADSSDCGLEVEDISISFKRPDFDAHIVSANGTALGVGFINDVRLELANVLDSSKTQAVEVTSTGLIDVE